MNWIDALILIMVLGFGVGGLFRGLIKEVGSLLGVIGGIFLGFRLNPVMVKFIGKIIPINDAIISVIAFSLIFLIVVVLVHFLMNLVNKLMQSLLLGGVDKVLGFLFGAFKGLLLASVVVILISLLTFINSVERAVMESKLASGTAKVAPFVYNKITGKDVSEDLGITDKLSQYLFNKDSESEEE